MESSVQFADVLKAKERLAPYLQATPLQFHKPSSKEHDSSVYLKREDLQEVRSYKIRGALNKMLVLKEQNVSEVVCASAGNHAQGVAWSCQALEMRGVVFMPITTPAQKVSRVKFFGDEFIEIRLIGDTFDEAQEAAYKYQNEHKASFVHPFDDPYVIAGQGTIGLEIVEELDALPEVLVAPCGGGGLLAGLSIVFNKLSPNTKIIAVEPEGAPSLTLALEKGEPSLVENINPFVDGAAVKQVGRLNYEVIQDTVSKVVTVTEDKICSTLLKFYNWDGMVVEPAGVLSTSALDYLEDEVKDKRVVCIISGGNNDLSRMEEMKERALLHDGLKHYFLVQFSQRPGSLKQFINEVLGEKDDITFFEYQKKVSNAKGVAVVGVELKSRSDFKRFEGRLKETGFFVEYLNDSPDLYRFIL